MCYMTSPYDITMNMKLRMPIRLIQSNDQYNAVPNLISLNCMILRSHSSHKPVAYLLDNLLHLHWIVTDCLQLIRLTFLNLRVKYKVM